MPDYHFVEDYERHVKDLLARYPLDEAMSLAVGGARESDFTTTGQTESQLMKNAGLANGMRLVDLGCGSGRLAAALHDTMEISYVGIDIIQSLLDYAKTKAPGYEFVLHRRLSIPQETASADMICAFSLFTHLLYTETYLYLEEAVRVLKSNGKLVFSFLEFADPAHWGIFAHAKEAQKVGTPPLNIFIERSVIGTWAAHLNLVVEKFIAGAEPAGNHGALGQAVAVLHKR